MIYKQLIKMLEDVGVTPIEAVGKEFDPNFHNAVMHVDDENLGENVVASELRRGTCTAILCFATAWYRWPTSHPAKRKLLNY